MRLSTVKRSSWFGVALVAAVALAASASAVVIKTRGALSAAGNGLAVLELRGVVTLRGAGLLVAERDAVVDAEGAGRVTPLDDRRVLFAGFGKVTVRSLDDRTRVEAAGAKLRLRARGVGVAVLKGVGHYMTDDQAGRWGGQRIELDGES